MDQKRRLTPAFFSTLACLILLANCATGRLRPLHFEYRPITDNYFGPTNNKPFPLTIQRGNNLYNSTTADGNYLFYTTDKHGNYDIFLRDLKSSVVIPVTNHPTGQYKPAISPNGKKLAFVSEEYDSDGDIVIMDMDPSAWVKDSLQGNPRIYEAGIHITNKNYKSPKISDRNADTDPAWSPDGNLLVFSSERFSRGIQNLVVCNTKNNFELKQITKEGGASPYWSLDGKFIYYLSFQDHPFGEIYSYEVSTGTIKRITNDAFLDFSPTTGPDGKFLYYTSIRKDTNQNGKLDERDNSFLVRKNLQTGEEQYLSSGKTSLFDTKYSQFNGGSILFSGAFFNSINIYFIPSSGSVPKKNSINEQFNFALRYKISGDLDHFFLALDSVKLYFENDPLFSVFSAKVLKEKLEEASKRKMEGLFKKLFKEARPEEPLKHAYALSVDGLRKGINPEPSIRKIFTTARNDKNHSLDLQASILECIMDTQDDLGKTAEAIDTGTTLITAYPNFYNSKRVIRKTGRLSFTPNSQEIPQNYILLASFKDLAKEDFRYLQKDLEDKIFSGKNYVEKLSLLEKYLTSEIIIKQAPEIQRFLNFLKAKALAESGKIKESNVLLDTVSSNLLPTDPLRLKIPLLRSKNFENMGNVNGSFDELRVYLENYDPEMGVDLEEEEIEKSFRYFENKAIEHEKRGNLREAALHYFYNTENMFLVKSKSLFLDTLYKNYAIYYQRKMVESIFQYGKKLAADKKDSVLNKVNILGQDGLDVMGNLTGGLSKVKLLENVKGLKSVEVFGDDALKLIELHYKQGLPRARPHLYLASLYGYAYYLINKAVTYENVYHSLGVMTPGRKQQILEDMKRAEYELKWILFADPMFWDAYQLLGWLYQYIDIIKTSKISSTDSPEVELYADAYNRYFPEKHFEENIELYKQILDFMGEHPNKKILSDLNLNLANNYFLLNNYPKANEHFTSVKKYSAYILGKAQFESYRQKALYHYNYARSLSYSGEFSGAAEELNTAIKIYTEKEYYPLLSKQGGPDKNYLEKLQETRKKLSLLYALTGHYLLEDGKGNAALRAFRFALELNKNSAYIGNVNLYNAIALCYQRMKNYKESEIYLAKAEKFYKPEKAGKTFSESFWSLAFPENARVIGDSRFPGALPSQIQLLLTMGIQVSGLRDRKEFDEARRIAGVRKKFMETSGISKSTLASHIATIDFYSNARSLSDKGYPKKATEEYLSFYQKNKTNILFAEKRKLLSRAGLSLFQAIESSRTDSVQLNQYLKLLLSEKKAILDPCPERLKTEFPLLNPEEREEECRTSFYRQWQDFDVYAGNSLYYLGTMEFSLGKTASAYARFGEAIPLLKNPSSIPEDTIGLSGDPFTKRERLRLMLNLARIYMILNDQEKFRDTTQFANELIGSAKLSPEKIMSLTLIAENRYHNSTGEKSIRDAHAFLLEAENELRESPENLYFLNQHVLGNMVELRKKISSALKNYNDFFNAEESAASMEAFRSLMVQELDLRDSSKKFWIESIRNNLEERKYLSGKIEDLAKQKKNSQKEEKKYRDLKTSFLPLIAKFIEKFPAFKPYFYWIGREKVSPEGSIALRVSPVRDGFIWQTTINGKEENGIGKTLPKTEFETLAKKASSTGKQFVLISQDYTLLRSLASIPALQAKHIEFSSSWNASFMPGRDRNPEYRFAAIMANDNSSNQKINTGLKEEIITGKSLGDKMSGVDLITGNLSDTIGYQHFGEASPGMVNLKELFENSHRVKGLIFKNHPALNAPLWNSFLQISMKTAGINDLLFLSGETPEKEINLQGQIKAPAGKGFFALKNYNTIRDGKIKNLEEKGRQIRESAREELLKGKKKTALRLLRRSLEFQNGQDSMLDLELEIATVSNSISGKNPFHEYAKLLTRYDSPNHQEKIIRTALADCYLQYGNCPARWKKSGMEKAADSYKIKDPDLEFFKALSETNLKYILEQYKNRLEFMDWDALTLTGKRLVSMHLLKLAEEFLQKAGNKSKTQYQKTKTTLALEDLEHAKLFIDGKNRAQKGQEKSNPSTHISGNMDTLTKRIHNVYSTYTDGSDFNPALLSPDITSDGIRQYRRLKEKDRNLLFYLLGESLSLQETAEINSLIDLLLEAEEKNNNLTRALFMAVFYSDKLLLFRDFVSLKKYIDYLEKHKEAVSVTPRLKELYTFLKYQTKISGEKWVEAGNTEMESLKKERDFHFELYENATKIKPKDFVDYFNQAFQKNKTFILDKRELVKWLHFIQYLQQLSFKANNSEIFFDLAYAADSLKNSYVVNGGRGQLQNIKPMKIISYEILKKLPKDQIFTALVDFGLMTFYIKFQNGKSNGDIAFKDNRVIRKSLFQYFQNLKENQNSILEKENIEDKYRKALKLDKNKMTYLYLSGYHFKAPIEPREEYRVYYSSSPDELVFSPEYNIQKDFIPGFGVQEPLGKRKLRSKLSDVMDWILINKKPTHSGNLTNLLFSSLKKEPNKGVFLGDVHISEATKSSKKEIGPWIFSATGNGDLSILHNLIQPALFTLDTKLEGPGVFNLWHKEDMHQAEFIRNLFKQERIRIPLRDRFMDAMESQKRKFPDEIFWQGYRLYTNRFLKEN